MSEPFRIGLIGCGTVGSGVARLLLEQPDRLAARAGRPLVLSRVVVLNPDKPRPVAIPPGLLVTDVRAVIDDPSIHCGVEVVGGTDWAKRCILDLLAAGKDVVTANKALLAQHGTEVFGAARRHGRAVAFEASVAGGVPVVAALSQCLAANQVLALQGILNGTSNFILSRMTDHGESYAEALKEAQRRGYAEADPTLDVNGTDAAHKLAILAQIAFGLTASVPTIERRGIQEVHELDIRAAREMGYTIRLLAEAWLTRDGEKAAGRPRQLAMHVSPVLLRQTTPLAQVRGVYNALNVVGDAVGDTLLYGQGAGQMPTASAVVADLIDMAVGRAQITFRTLGLWSGNGDGVVLQPSGGVRSRFYLRLLVVDPPGVMAEITRELARQQVSIASVIQHEALDEHEGDTVPLVIMTHTTPTGSFRAAVSNIGKLDCVTAPAVFFPVSD
jgi:homoserine dehydrogenase